MPSRGREKPGTTGKSQSAAGRHVLPGAWRITCLPAASGAFLLFHVSDGRVKLACHPNGPVSHRPVGHLLADHFQIVVVEADGFGRAEIKNHPAVGYPMGLVKAKNRRASLEIAH